MRKRQAKQPGMQQERKARVGPGARAQVPSDWLRLRRERTGPRGAVEAARVAAGADGMKWG